MVVARQRTCLSNTVWLQINSPKSSSHCTEGRDQSLFRSAALRAAGRCQSWNVCGYGVSETGRFCFKVSMRDKTPRFTLVVTLLVTESAGGGGGRTFCEGGLATKHF